MNPKRVSAQFSVRVRDDFPFDAARVGNRPYTKTTPVIVAEADLTDEIRNSPALLVEEMADEPAIVPPSEPPVTPETSATGENGAPLSADNASESDMPAPKKSKRG